MLQAAIAGKMMIGNEASEVIFDGKASLVTVGKK
jgi:hypothetical protein